MKRTLLLMAFFLCVTISAVAQVSNKEVVQVTTDITGASTCQAGHVYYNPTSLVNWERNNAGVCAKITSGGTPGTVTSIATTLPITGGTITTTGTIACATCTTSAASLTLNQLLFGAGTQGIAVGDLTGDVTTAGGKATTLASVISAGGPTGSATVTPIITYDAKGRLTTVSSATITPAVGSITGLGTGVQAALGVNIGSAGAPVLFNGAAGTPASINLANGTALPTTGLNGTLQAAQEPAHTGDVTNSAGSLALTIANNAVTLAKLATQATNTVLGNATSGTAVPAALAVGSCSTSGSALIWTTNTGFGCNTAIAASTVTTNANLTGPITSIGNATSIASQTGTGTKFVVDTSPTIVTPVINSAAHVGGTWVADATWTLPAHTLGGTVSGGGNQINNVVIGTSTPLAGSFTTVTASTSATVGGAGGGNSFLFANSGTNSEYMSFNSTGGTGWIGMDSSVGGFNSGGAAYALFITPASNRVTQFGYNAGTGVAESVSTVGNIKIGSSLAVRGTTEGTSHLDIFDGTAPVGTLTNGISLYSTAGELRVMDSGGTATLLSSHSRITGEWIHDSYSSIQKKRLIVQTEQMSKFIDAKFGTHFVQEIYDDPSERDANTVAPFTPTDMGGCKVITPTPGATVTITIDPTVREAIATWTAGENETVNISGTPQDGARLTLLVNNDASLIRTITLSTGVSVSAVIIGTVSKKSTVSLIAYNGTFYETGRTVGF